MSDGKETWLKSGGIIHTLGPSSIKKTIKMISKALSDNTHTHKRHNK